MLGKVIYVGQSVNIGSRWRSHLWHIFKDDKCFKYRQMREVIDNYVSLEFDILEDVADHH